MSSIEGEAQRPANQVRAERLKRGLSVRQAASRGGISNTYWGEFEDYRRPLTPYIADAVAKAFEWPKDWLERYEAAERQLLESLEPVEEALVDVDVTQLGADVSRLDNEVRQLRRAVRELQEHASWGVENELDATHAEGVPREADPSVQ